MVPNRYYKRVPKLGIYVYNFSEKPNSIQPSGIFNFPVLQNTGNSSVNNIDNFKFLNVNKFNLGLKVNSEGSGDKVLKMYATTYNILLINGDGKYVSDIFSGSGQGQTKLLFG